MVQTFPDLPTFEGDEPTFGNNLKTYLATGTGSIEDRIEALEAGGGSFSPTITSPASEQVIGYDGSTWKNVYTGPTMVRADTKYGLSSTQTAAQRYTSLQNALNGVTAGVQLYIPPGTWTYTNAGTGLIWDVVSNTRVFGSSRGATRIQRTDTDDVAAFTQRVTPSGGEAMTNVYLEGLGFGYSSQRPATQTNATCCAYTQTSGSALGIASGRWQDLYFYSGANGWRMQAATSIQLGVFQCEFNDLYGQGLSRSFFSYNPPVATGTTNNTGRKWHFNNNGQSLAVTEPAIELVAGEWHIDDIDVEGNDASATGRARIVGCDGDVTANIGVLRAENWHIPAGETGGALCYAGQATIKLGAFRYTFSNVNTGAGNLVDLWNVSNVGSVKIDFFRLRHAITAGTLRVFNGDSSGPPIEIGSWDDSSAGVYTYSDTTAGFLERFKSFNQQEYMRTKAGAPTDADLKLVKNGAYMYDTTNNRLYIRAGGSWRYKSIDNT